MNLRIILEQSLTLGCEAAEAPEVSEADGAANGSAEAGLDDHDHSDIQDDQDLAALLGAALNEDHEDLKIVKMP